MPSPSSAPGPTRTIEPADLCRLRSVADVALHPDGRSAVLTVSWPDAETDGNRSVLEVCPVDPDGGGDDGDRGGAGPRRLTDGHRDHRTRFSPDGTRLAFLRGRSSGPTGVMLLDWATGAVTEVVSRPDGIEDVRWAGDGRLVVLAARRPDDQEGIEDAELDRRPRILSRIEYRFNGRGWIDDRPGQVFVIDEPGPGAGLREIGPPGVDHRSIAPSPDGRWVAATGAADDDRDLTGSNDVWLLEAGPPGGAPPTPSGPPLRLTRPGGVWTGLAWHPDGPLVGFGMVDGGRVGFGRPHRIGLPDRVGLGGGPVPDVAPLTDADQNVGPSPASTAVAVDGGFLFPGVRRGRIGVDRYGFDGVHTVVHEGDDQVLAFDASADGSLLIGAVTSPTRPAELWRLDGRATRLVGYNDALLDHLDLAPVEEVVVTSADGTEVHGFVATPPDGAPDPGPDGRPGLVYVHGGPMFQYGLGFFDEFQMAAACGYVVIGGNPRGSDGYGEAWARAIAGDLGNRDWADVTALADHLAARPDVDTDRLGIGGGSYGGFMAGWALARDGRFKAGLVERAVTSWTTMFGTSDIGSWFTERTIGATIEGDPEEVRRQSPLTYAADIAAPTLILHSEEDWRCPIEQAEQLFAAIRRNGGRATLVRFPGENHELSRSGRPSHRIERFEIIHEFFARHLGGAHFGTSHLTR
jgi:dipeptidyl aminopeptidase/acylaminoacyl peptidase